MVALSFLGKPTYLLTHFSSPYHINTHNYTSHLQNQTKQVYFRLGKLIKYSPTFDLFFSFSAALHNS